MVLAACRIVSSGLATRTSRVMASLTFIATSCRISFQLLKDRIDWDRALRRATIALSSRILSNVCPVALLVNIGAASSLGSFPFARVVRFGCVLLGLLAAVICL
jgi:hypothetical protein